MKECLINTPVEEYVDPETSLKYFVKREDLCVPAPGPPFSKMRGLLLRLERLKASGKRYIGYTESAISMAGWGVAWACYHLDLQAVIFDPQYKDGNTPALLEYHRERWKEHGAILFPQDAGMVRVNYNIARQILRDKFSSSLSEMLPIGLTFPETVDATAAEAEETLSNRLYHTIVINVGSGTIAAGVCRAVEEAMDTVVYAIMGRSGNADRKRESIRMKGRFTTRTPGAMVPGVDFRLIDPGWVYSQRSMARAPFPCHPYYDLKAFEWMRDNIHHLKQPILFWNIGSMPEEVKL